MTVSRVGLGRHLGKQILHRGDRIGGLRAVGTAALRHVGAAATALPAERRDRGLDEIDRADPADEIVGDADRDTRRGLR
jgi:hypothetical protein